MAYDVMIIGGGTAGLRASIIAAKSGFDTALIEPAAMGGTCLNTGCIPTKTLLHSAELYQEMQASEEYGIQTKNVDFDFLEIMNRMRKIVTTGRTHAEESVEKIDNITHYNEKAKFVSKDTVKVGDEEITADKIIIATGSSPWTPPIEGLEETGYMTNVEALKLDELPESIVMIGGGYISCEFASFFATLGAKVTILERQPRILGMLDEDVSQLIHEKLEEKNVEIYTNVDIKQVSGENHDRVELKTTPVDEEEPVKKYTGESLFVSTGRRPNTEHLNLEKAKVETEKGHIVVDEKLQSANPNIYAVGDVNGKSPFAHTAKRESRIALENSLLGKNRTLEHDKIPWAVFTFPPIGGVGMNEQQAKKEHDIEIMKGKFSKTGKAKIIGKEEGFAKVIYDKETKKILGATIIGADAPNLIHEIAALLTTNAKIGALTKTVHVHPTLAEVMTELKKQ